MTWHYLSSQIVTSLGKIPGPVQVWEESKILVAEHKKERIKEVEFYERQEQRNSERKRSYS